MATMRVKLVKSGIGYTQRQKDTLRGLGLTRMQKTMILEDTPAIRGMVKKVSHLVEVLENN
ncbi:MAG: 50S ribosomal protein L30 [Desulfarculales bacterium]|jgi:large subunit ribosomal protein L30|nr:50S ribosomal protein L30 [Desulfarculales bacterium]